MSESETETEKRLNRATEIVKRVLLARRCEVIDEELADERARNAVTALMHEFDFETEAARCVDCGRIVPIGDGIELGDTLKPVCQKCMMRVLMEDAEKLPRRRPSSD